MTEEAHKLNGTRGCKSMWWFVAGPFYLFLTLIFYKNYVLLVSKQEDRANSM
jgi:hypothetical protein